MRAEELPPGGLRVANAFASGDSAEGHRLLTELLFDLMHEACIDIVASDSQCARDRLTKALELQKVVR